MSEAITKEMEQIRAISTEDMISTSTAIVSAKATIEDGYLYNGVSEGFNLQIEKTHTSNFTITTEMVFKEHGGVSNGAPDMRDVCGGEGGTVADQFFDEMSQQINTKSDVAAAAAVSTVLVEDIAVVQQVVGGMSEGGLIVDGNETTVNRIATESMPKVQRVEEQDVFGGMSDGEVSEDDDDDYDAGSEDDEEEEWNLSSKSKRKRKLLSDFIPAIDQAVGGFESLVAMPNATLKKLKKRQERVWRKSSSRKGKKKSKLNSSNDASVEDKVFITPVSRFPDRSDDSADMTICLSKAYKAEKVELSEDRLSAGSTKGYRMVRATRGVVEGAWYFEIKILKLGETGHTRLGWSMEKGDLQAPVGYDANSFGYRDIDGTKVHKAKREEYGESGYVEGDTIGVYINLPDGAKYAPKPSQYVWYKGHKYTCAADGKEEVPKVVPGSEICFFKNGVCQGVAFKDLYGGRYYPAASMYTLPNQPNCMVKFNFGPEFECFPRDFDSRPLPLPMIDVPYLGFDGGADNGVPDEKKC